MGGLDRFKLPVDPICVAECESCGGEIYAGDEVKRIDDAGGFVHNGFERDCATRYAEERVYDASGVIDRERYVN
jgi:hypothetical protein